MCANRYCKGLTLIADEAPKARLWLWWCGSVGGAVGPKIKLSREALGGL